MLSASEAAINNVLSKVIKKSSSILFKGMKCSIDNVYGSGVIDGNGNVYSGIEAKMIVSYSCNMRKKYDDNSFIINESGHISYWFQCKNNMYKTWTSGFDTYDNGKFSHWDSVHPMPWTNIDLQVENGSSDSNFSKETLSILYSHLCPAF